MLTPPGDRFGDSLRFVNYRGTGFGVVVNERGVDYVLTVDGTIEDALASEVRLNQILEAVSCTDFRFLPELDSEMLMAPLMPGKIVCIGYNYRGHLPDGDKLEAEPEFPEVFLKTPNVLAGPNDQVYLPDVPAEVDYEGELAIVIGKVARKVPIEKALTHVAGYTLLNDVTARDWQRRTSQWTLGKCFDTFGPLGPWVITSDELRDPHDLLLEVERDGIVTVSQSTSTMIFSVPFLVHYISQVMTLYPGDVISTGSPQKLAEAQNSHRPIAEGDTVTVRVREIGELVTRFSRPTGGPA